MNFVFPGRWSIQVTMIGLLAACASPPMTLPGPVTYERTPRVDGGLLLGPSGLSQTPPGTTVAPMPTPPVLDARQPEPARTGTPAPGDDEPVSIALEQTPLPLFIQILYGNVLKRPYSIDPAVNARTDLVTFKTTTPISRSRLSQLGVVLLRSYGLVVQDLEGLIRVVPDSAPAASPPPVLRRGRTLPETPEALRPAFQHVELDVVRATDVSQWLRQILGTRVNVQEDSVRNGFLLAGTQSDLRTALDLIRVLDQPRMRGNVARRITPAYMAANDFASRLVEVLTAQGYSISSGASGNTAILLVPIPAINAVMAFANTEPVMDHLIRWAAEIDQPAAIKAQNGLYTYPVKYADAQELAKTLGEILSGIPAPSPAAQGGIQPAGAAAAAAAAANAAPRPSGNRVVVNTATNTLIFRGTTADEYQQIMSLMRELDRPVKSAMIEVVVAELSFGGTQSLGIEWGVPTETINSGRNVITGGTLGSLGVGTSGFSVSLGNSAGQLLARLSALASSNQARILSNPKVLARNGETASIQVGQEVPVVTSQQSTGTTGGLFGNTGVLQQISYRSTGVILRVRPVINSGNRLDLDLSQEVSSAQQTSTGVSASPTISTRRIETKLSLRDGSTVLLGGLISRNQSDGDLGVPFLKDIPGLGALFRSQNGNNSQIELLIMITPYVVSDDFESESISEAIQKSFGDWAQDIRRSRVVPVPEATPTVVVPQPPVQAAPKAPRTTAPVSGTTAPSVMNVAPAGTTLPTTPAPMDTGKPAAVENNDGVSMSKPDASRQPPPETSPAVKPAADGAAVPKAPLPPAVPPGSREVTDPKVKDEIMKQLEKKR